MSDSFTPSSFPRHSKEIHNDKYPEQILSENICINSSIYYIKIEIPIFKVNRIFDTIALWCESTTDSNTNTLCSCHKHSPAVFEHFYYFDIR